MKNVLKKILYLAIGLVLVCSSFASCANVIPKDLRANIDFVVKVDKDKNPVILHITDPQIIDSSQMRNPDRINQTKIDFWGKDKIDERFINYLNETGNTTKPDLILVTGDLVYGEFDDNGSSFKAFVKAMDSFGIPWAPVFGNHEAESEKGVEWQCRQLERAKHCLFKRRSLVGYGHYTIAISQGGKITRVFFMMDSNGCSNPSEKTKNSSQFTMTIGMGDDQIEWFYTVGKQINQLLPQTKISFAFHIQMRAFESTYLKYNIESYDRYEEVIDVKTLTGSEGDFGLIGTGIGYPWDTYSGVVFSLMTEIGADSVFVGHEHCNSSSIVVDGVRFQYGQKISSYDSCNWITNDGEIIKGSAILDAKPLVGGAVNVLNSDGEFVDGYIYYCK